MGGIGILLESVMSIQNVTRIRISSFSVFSFISYLLCTTDFRSSRKFVIACIFIQCADLFKKGKMLDMGCDCVCAFVLA